MSEVPAIMQRLEELKEEQNRIAEEQDALWRAFYAIADKEAGPGKPYRFLDTNNGKVIARSVRESQSLDQDRLRELLSDEEWEHITLEVRVLDQTLLEAALKKGEIPVSAVEKCTTVKMFPARLGPRKASKEELAELEEQEAR
jgi:hypothetical protein